MPESDGVSERVLPLMGVFTEVPSLPKALEAPRQDSDWCKTTNQAGDTGDGTSPTPPHRQEISDIYPKTQYSDWKA